jgi:hypothetical protein
MAEEKKKNVKDYLDALVDKQGLKTEVTITLTDTTLIKTCFYLIGTAIIIIGLARMASAIGKSKS